MPVTSGPFPTIPPARLSHWEALGFKRKEQPEQFFSALSEVY